MPFHGMLGNIDRTVAPLSLRWSISAVYCTASLFSVVMSTYCNVAVSMQAFW